MALTWTENQTDVDFADTSPADNVQTKADIDLADNGYDLVQAQIVITWHASATDYADINLYSSPNSGSNDDSIAYFSQRVDADAGNTTRITVWLENVAYVAIEVDNQSNQEISTLDLVYAGRSW